MDAMEKSEDKTRLQKTFRLVSRMRTNRFGISVVQSTVSGVRASFDFFSFHQTCTNNQTLENK
jgi:hypothetical protein